MTNGEMEIYPIELVPSKLPDFTSFPRRLPYRVYQSGTHD